MLEEQAALRNQATLVQCEDYEHGRNFTGLDTHETQLLNRDAFMNTQLTMADDELSLMDTMSSSQASIASSEFSGVSGSTTGESRLRSEVYKFV